MKKRRTGKPFEKGRLRHANGVTLVVAAEKKKVLLPRQKKKGEQAAAQKQETRSIYSILFFQTGFDAKCGHTT